MAKGLIPIHPFQLHLRLHPSSCVSLLASASAILTLFSFSPLFPSLVCPLNSHVPGPLTRMLVSPSVLGTGVTLFSKSSLSSTGVSVRRAVVPGLRNNTYHFKWKLLNIRSIFLKWNQVVYGKDFFSLSYFCEYICTFILFISTHFLQEKKVLTFHLTF